MADRSARIGLHARNDYTFAEGDYLVIREARIETLKILSFTQNRVFERVRRENPDLEFIVRLHDTRIRSTHPSPEDFVDAAVPRINDLRAFTLKFEILNEPNHSQGYEGWGSSDAEARSFRDWYLEALRRLRRACPWAKFGFPGLAPHWPHGDLEWLEICREAVEASDWVGCHTYWQYDNQLKNDWGLRFKAYHERFPAKIIEITEFGNSTPNLSGDIVAAQYAIFYQELFKYPYVGSASAFIASSADPQWAHFVWRKESGETLPMIRATGNIRRPPLVAPRPATPTPLYKVDWLRYTAPPRMVAGQPAAAGMKLSNAGTKTWETDRVRIGYRWYTPQGKPVNAVEDVRTRLPANMGPGMILTLNQVQLSMPALPGDFTLKWDLLEGEDVWFSSRGSPTLDVEATVEPLSPSDGLYFAEAKCTVSGAFLDYYRELGPETCGYPITNAVTQKGVRTQYFQNIAMEEHAPNQIRLKPVGSEAHAAQAKIAELEGRIKALEVETARLQGILTHLTSGEGDTLAQIPDITDSLPKHEDKTYTSRVLEDIRNFIIHHTAVSPDVGPEAIARYHVKRRDWPGIGYHFVVMADGTTHQTNRLETVSYHARQANPTSIGIAFAGNFMGTEPTATQLESGGRLLSYLMQKLNLTSDSIKGHKDFVPTACPGNQWDTGTTWHDHLLGEVDRAIAPIGG